MRFLIINTDYEQFLAKMYRERPALSKRPFTEQYHARMETLFGVNDFYSSNLRKLGHEAVDLIYNNVFLQFAWAHENNSLPTTSNRSNPLANFSPGWLEQVFLSQVQMYRPEVIVNLAMDGVGSTIMQRAKAAGAGLIVGQHAAPLTSCMSDLSAYDLIISSIPGYVDFFRSRGKPSEYVKLAFEPEVLNAIEEPAVRDIDVAFVGGFSGRHAGGSVLFNFLAERGFQLALYGYGAASLSAKARSFFKGELYGKEMYELYRRSKIVINRHIDISGEYANNMRLYEATGSGALLLTDMKINLGTLFTIGQEAAVYDSPESCADQVTFFLHHAAERETVALGGHQRTLGEHTYYHRMTEIGTLVEKYLARRHAPAARPYHFSSAQISTFETCIDIESDGLKEGLARVKSLARRHRFGEWVVKFNGLIVHCHDLLSFYMAAKDIFLHRIYAFDPQSDSPTVIDGGGHIGLFTLFIKQHYPGAKITVFEPDPDAVQLLQTNLLANSIGDVTVIRAGLHRERGTLSFSSNGSDGSSFCGNAGDTPVRVVTLGDYLEGPVDFLKLNIEGAEHGVIEQIAPVLPTIHEIVIEYHGFPEVGQKLHNILAHLHQAGFRYLIHDFDAETNPATKPPFRIGTGDRYFLLIYAKRLYQRVAPAGHPESCIRPTALKPVSARFGFDRGTPIDRYYIEKFLQKNAPCIRGSVLEIGESTYTRKFGQAVTHCDVLNVTASPDATIVGDLASGENIPQDTYDCIILVQTLQMIYRMESALKNAFAALKPGGTLLLTASGISQISRYDMERWGEFWRFTDCSLRRLLEPHASPAGVRVETYGNVSVAKAFLDGLAAEELPSEVLDCHDKDYQVLISAVVHRVAPVEAKIPPPVTRSYEDAPPMVLLYHRIADDPIDSQLLAVSPDFFDAHLNVLSERYRVVSLAQLLKEDREGTIPAGTVAITFDDGYLDNLHNAVPLLEKYGIPATVFVTSGMVGSSYEFWWDALESIFLTTRPLPSLLEFPATDGALRLTLDSPRERLIALDRLAEFLRPQSFDVIDPLIDQLFRWAGLDRTARPTHRAVGPYDLKTMAASSSIDIGSHTVTHTRLGGLDCNLQRKEIKTSKAQLESLIEAPVTLLSYPFGAWGDFTEVTMRLLAEEGYEAGIANIQGSLKRPLNRYCIPRWLIRNWPGQTFQRWLESDRKPSFEARTLALRHTRLTKTLTEPSLQLAQHGETVTAGVNHIHER